MQSSKCFICFEVILLHLSQSVAGGPFVIKCAGKDLYLTVNRFNNYEVEGTELPAEASLFYFLPTDNGGDPFYFHIAYYNEDIGSNEEESSSEPVCRYLEAPVDVKGTHKHTLYMKHSVKARYCRFALRSRLAKKHTRSSLGSWVSSDNALYIACATKKRLHGSYLGLKYSKKSSVTLGAHFYTTACFPSIHQHNGENTFLLFQLLPKNRLSTTSLAEGIDDSPTPKAVTPLPQSTPVAGKENVTPQKQ